MTISLRKSAACIPRNRSAFIARPVSRRLAVTPAALFGTSKRAAPKKTATREVISPKASFNLPISLLAIAGAEFYGNLTGLAAFTALLGVFLTIQATRVRFQFDDEGLEVVVAGQESNNAFVGGKNKWSYDSFVNWEFWFPNFPVLVYFKETQTKPEGQIHFFPIIFDGKELYDVMVERCGPSKTSGPK